MTNQPTYIQVSPADRSRTFRLPEPYVVIVDKFGGTTLAILQLTPEQVIKLKLDLDDAVNWVTK